ncbi:uncharacterized protein LOC143848409 [Tasmannia lanceolata]|uniref:uncharacterized protein LOC143848409 n=1 Tax=Tasmannia lanceolata TaxID=3420 RepID=UPI004062CC50
MDPQTKPSSLRNLLIRTLLFGVLILLLRFIYIAGDFCFFSGPEKFNLGGGGAVIDSNAAFVRLDGSTSSSPSDSAIRDLWTSREWRRTVDFYSSVFQDLILEGFLPPSSKALCVGTLIGQEVFALKEIGIVDAIGISKKPYPPLVISDGPRRLKFNDDTFDFVFASSGIDRIVARLEEFASEITRTLKPKGFLVVHTTFANDVYSMNSLLDLFNCCRLVRSREINGGPDSLMIREIVLKKEIQILGHGEENPNGSFVNKCSVPEYKRELVQKAEPFITEEPLKPWITLKRNIKNIKYLPSMVNISFKPRYVYVDVGARSYGSSIGSWFKKQYPKQNRTFEVYAIEADRVFHDEYRKKKGVNLLPYAAWVRNETLFFEINRDPGKRMGDKGRGMGRIRPFESSILTGNVDRIRGFDFANWLKSAVSKRDFVVMKMDIEGTEFDLIPRLFETGAICLIDELFLECHYNRWQKCCPGERSSKYQKTYDQCLELFSSLRESGILVHQWW